MIWKKREIEMTTRTAETSPLIRARAAGFLYLSLLPLSLLGILYPRVAQRDHSEEPKSTGIDLFLPESNVLHALTWMQNCAAGQTRAHSAERRSRLQCMTSLSSSVPRAFSPQPRWLVLVDPLPIRRAPTG